jgi:hypothetical protein
MAAVADFGLSRALAFGQVSRDVPAVCSKTPFGDM